MIAGGTPGVLDEQGQTIPALAPRDVRALVKSGTASAGMVAKLTACVAAAKGGVKNVVVVDGRDAKVLGQMLALKANEAATMAGTRVTS